MRYRLNTSLYYSLVSVIGLLLLASNGYGLTYTSLSHQPILSPDGGCLVMIKEDRYVRGSEFSLHIWTMFEDGKHFANNYALTPQYREVVSSPDGKFIAFVELNMKTHYGVHFYLTEKKEVASSLAYSIERIDSLQFSKDQKYYRFRNTLGHKFDRAKENLSAILLGPAWRISNTYNGGPVFKKDKNHLWKKKETDEFTEWAPIKRPEVVPQFLRQPMPKITLETQDRMKWSPDSMFLYLFDETGLWRCEVGNYYMPRWTKLVNQTGIIRFELSPKGTDLLYEVNLTDQEKEAKKLSDPDDLERIIWLLNLEKTNEEMWDIQNGKHHRKPWILDATQQLSPKRIVNGWGAKYHPNGKVIFYANLEGAHRLILDSMENKKYHGIGIRP